jgi:predicted nucleic acid-binding protein
MRFVDTNIFIRYLTGDDAVKSQAAYDLFQRVKSRRESVTSADVIIAEVIYVLSSPVLCNLSRAVISARLAPILSLRGFKLEHKRAVLRALELYAAHRFLDFEDALAVAHMERRGITEIVSYDTDFDRIAGITRIEP